MGLLYKGILHWDADKQGFSVGVPISTDSPLRVLCKGFLDWNYYIKGYFIGAPNPSDFLLGYPSKGLSSRMEIYEAPLLGLQFKRIFPSGISCKGIL